MTTRKKADQDIESILSRGGIGVMPTDTIYGLIGSAFSRKAIKRIYRLRKRSSEKPFIILIGNLSDLKKFKIKLNIAQKIFLEKYWPGKLSVVLTAKGKQFVYLSRGQKTLAFRLPAKKVLRKLLSKTGPLVAPSANFEGRPAARTIREAERYFGGEIDFYLDGGKLVSKPSTLADIRGKRPVVLRKGAVKIREII